MNYDITFSNLEANESLRIMISEEQKEQFDSGELNDMRKIKNFSLHKECIPVGMNYGDHRGDWYWLDVYYFTPEDVLKKALGIQELKRKK